MENKKRNTLVGVITAIILILIVVGIIGLVYSLTNGFTEDFKTFTVEYGDELLPLTGKKLCFERGSENKFTVNYVFDAPNAESKDYNVKIVANAETDFEFTVDEQRFSWRGMGDVTKAFAIKKEATSFTLTIPEGYDAEKVLQALFEGKEVSAPHDGELDDPYLYTLMISSYNDSVIYRVNFCIQTGNGADIDVSPDHIIF